MMRPSLSLQVLMVPLLLLLGLSLGDDADGPRHGAPGIPHPEDQAAAAAVPPDAAHPNAQPLQQQMHPSDNNNNNINMDGSDVFDLLDRNHDGRMDRAEFVQAVDQFEVFLRQHPVGSASGLGWWSRFGSGAGGGKKKEDLRFWSGFTSAVAMILATEIGDKTFFIAAVLSMKHSRSAVFGGAIAALVLMTILSTLMGLLLPALLPRQYTHVLAGILFCYFGLRLLWESQHMASNKVSEELEEVEEELLQQSNKKGDDQMADDSCPTDDGNGNNTSGDDMEAGARKRGSSTPTNGQQQHKIKHGHAHNKQRRRHHQKRQPWHMLLLQSFTLTFVAEWGDRSQIATIALAAHKNPYGVTVGGCIGHCLCTGLAVLGGRMLAARISEKTVSRWGGVLFFIFGVHSLFWES